MDINGFTEALAEICEHSLVSPGRPLACTIILNPSSGGFAIKSRWKPIVRTMEEYREKAKANPKRPIHKEVDVIRTEEKGCGERISKKIIERMEKEPSPFYLIITAGGDGTHSEAMFALYHALVVEDDGKSTSLRAPTNGRPEPAHIRSNMAILRLPMGTGNDGADSASLAGALDKLINPVYIDFAPAVQLVPSHNGAAIKNGPYLAFNILSVGLDAFVTHMTNKMKGKMPGDSYKLWVNIAALFYDRVYKVDFLNVRMLDQQNREILSFREKILLLAMGASGHRTYGSQEKILPDDRNVCGIKQMPLHRKLAIKGQVTKGKHTNNKDVIILNSHRVEFSGRHPILAQMDGETVLLQPEDFPAALELTAPVIPFLKKA